MQLDASAGGTDKAAISMHPEQSCVPSSSSDFQEEKEELEWVLRQPEISHSASLVRFLSFICNKYFEGESKDIREHMIAVEALGRKKSSFDSHVDPIVRVTARSLRNKLHKLYEGDGQGRQLQIVLPLGHYVPQFVRSASLGAESASPAEVASIDQVQIESAALNNSIPPVAQEGDAGSAKWRILKGLPVFGVNLRAVWKPALLLLAVPAIFLAGLFIGLNENQQRRSAGEAIKWGDPIWSDEFDGAAQQLPDPSKWNFDLEKQVGLGNHEREIYCSPGDAHSRECDPHHPNAFLDGAGHLVLRAERNANGIWTLARITTKGLHNFQYGRIEARMKLPVGAGLWPSFLMVGADSDAVGWPASGSVDIVENVSITPGSNGLGPTMIRATLHGPRYFGGNGLWHDFKFPNGARVDDGNFHTYGIIWSPGMVQFYVDDPANIFFVQDASSLPEGGEWVFDHPFYLMMNLALGGEWPGDSNSTTPNPADMLVDFVRVYKIPTVPAPRIEWQSVQVKAGSSAASTVSLRSHSYAGRVHLACSTDAPTVSFTEKGRMVASPGHYKVIITATTISGDRSQVIVPFEIKNGE
jgi:beta-glucanase (GH16 family)